MPALQNIEGLEERAAKGELVDSNTIQASRNLPTPMTNWCNPSQGSVRNLVG